MARKRYNLENIKKGILNPSLIMKEAHHISTNLKKTLIINQMYDGENFIDKDWDNLIILDACRPDFFKKFSPFDGEFESKISLGSSSGEFFTHNFRGNQYHDTVYVTGNTHVEGIDDESVHRIVKTYADDIDYQKGWLPETTLDIALEAYEEHPNKRLVVHFMQPHAPYLSERADELRQKVTDEYGVGFRYADMMGREKQNSDERIRHLLSAFEHGYIQRCELEEVYAENLRLVFEYVAELLNHIDGKTIITADHSESFGDFKDIYGNKIYDHKNYALSGELRKVPWLVIDGDRRNTFAEQPVESLSVNEETVRENLRDLGYL